MKRLHVHVAVDNLDTAIGFYSTLFAAEPTVVKGDYAKWMLEDPRVNFAISNRGARKGLNCQSRRHDCKRSFQHVCPHSPG